MRLLSPLVVFLSSITLLSLSLLANAKVKDRVSGSAGKPPQRIGHQFKMVPTPPSVSSGPFPCKEAEAINNNMVTILRRIPPHTGMRERLANGDILPLHPECMHLNAGWWKYELCWDKWVRQIHEENGVIHAEYFLGLGKDAKSKDTVATRPLQYTDGEYSVHKKILRSDPDLLPPELAKFTCEAELTEGIKWRFKETKKKQLKAGLWDTAIPDQQQFPLLVKSELTEGTLCDLTGKPRQTELVALCDRSGILGGVPYHQPQSPVFFNVTETEPCRYQVVVGGPAVCDAMMMDTAAKASGKTTLHSNDASNPEPNTAGSSSPHAQRNTPRTPGKVEGSPSREAFGAPTGNDDRIRPSEGETQRNVEQRESLKKAKEEAKSVREMIEQRKRKAQADLERIQQQMDEVKQQEETERRIAEALQNENSATTIDLTDVDINGIDDPEIQRQVAEALAKKVLQGHGVISGFGGQLGGSADSSDDAGLEDNPQITSDYDEGEVDTMIFSL